MKHKLATKSTKNTSKERKIKMNENKRKLVIEIASGIAKIEGKQKKIHWHRRKAK